jgi:hypothetical protein
MSERPLLVPTEKSESVRAIRVSVGCEWLGVDDVEAGRVLFVFVLLTFRRPRPLL